MSKISQLLGAKQPMFDLAIRQLEKASGRQSLDVKLTAEIHQKAMKAMDQMGLDPGDTTGPELYSALLNQAKVHDEHLAAQIGGNDPENVEEMLPLCLKAIEATDMNRRCFALKKSVAKEFLRKTPPKNIMKVLGYRSVDSMLKNENIFEVYGALRFAESDEWLKQFNHNYDTIKPSDFESRQIELVVMSKERWGDIAKSFVEKKRHLNTHLKELGVVLILPSPIERIPGITTKIMSLTYHYYNEVRLYSAFFKHIQMKKDFAADFVDTLIAGSDKSVAVLQGQNIHWRVIQQYYGRHTGAYHPEMFEPHVQPEDLHWRHAQEQMFLIDPELRFWEGMDYVALYQDGRPTTFNFMDVSFGQSNQIPYEDRLMYHFRESLWNEVFMRYMGEKTLEEQILKQLDNDMIAPEKLKVKD